MKKTTNLNDRKHLSVQKLRNSELKATLAGEIITCGMQGDLCKNLTVEVPECQTMQHENHKVVLS